MAAIGPDDAAAAAGGEEQLLRGGAGRLVDAGGGRGGGGRPLLGSWSAGRHGDTLTGLDWIAFLCRSGAEEPGVFDGSVGPAV